MAAFTQCSDRLLPLERLNSRLSLWMLRPYLDLTPVGAGPLHVQCIEQGWCAFADETRPPFLPQRAMPPGFRLQLGEEAGAPYALSDPRELPEHLRSSRWETLCQSLDNWSDLQRDQQCRLASFLHSMCMYRLMLTLIPEAGVSAGFNFADDFDLMFWRTSASFLSKLLKRTSHYEYEDMAVFQRIALNALDVVPVGFNATAKIFVHKAKTRAAVSELVERGNLLEKALLIATSSMDEFTAGLYTSRFYRGIGFLPQRNGDKGEVIRLMDLAEFHARKMKPATAAQAVLYRENMHALLESRTKEALWLGDKDLALARALGVVEVDPFDSKAWAEVGQVRFLREEWRKASEAYAAAAMLGPPASAVGRYMAGACLRKLDLHLLSALLFKDTLEIDPLGISPREQIRELPDVEVLSVLKRWSDSTTGC
jgi:tetratricopeptide (TPR) repeat protein